MFKKIVLVAVMTAGLAACATSPGPKEDSRLKEAYSACINTAQGSPEKIEACQSVLNVTEKREGARAVRHAGERPGDGLSSLHSGA